MIFGPALANRLRYRLRGPVNILDRYIVRTILGSVLMVVCVLLMLGALFIFIDQQDDIGTGRYTALSALWYTLLNLPQQAFELLPITALIGSLLGLGSLARGSELTVMRATGMSIARLAGTALIAGLILVASGVLLGEFLGPPLQQTAREQKAFSQAEQRQLRRRRRRLGARRRPDPARRGAVRRDASSAACRSSSCPRSTGCSRSATRRSASVWSKGKWLLGDYAESRFRATRVSKSDPGQRILESNVTAGFLGLAVQNPEQLTNRALWRLISYYRTNSLSRQRVRVRLLVAHRAHRGGSPSRCCWRSRSCSARCAPPAPARAC